MSPEMRLELQRLLSALCDGELDAARHARLEELLGDDAESRRLYLEYMDLHARLITHPRVGSGEAFTVGVEQTAGTAVGPIAASLPIASAAGPESARARRRLQLVQAGRYALVAATTLAASLLVQALWWRPRPSVDDRIARSSFATDKARSPVAIATLTRTAHCIWENPTRAWDVGSRLYPGEMHLRAGVARVHFDSGSDLTIEGPADLRLESSTTASVLRGKVVFRGDETATPFDLFTPTSTLLDIGTEYAVSVGPQGEEIHVFDGELQRMPKSSSGGSSTEPPHGRRGASIYARSPRPGRADDARPEEVRPQVQRDGLPRRPIRSPSSSPTTGSIIPIPISSGRARPTAAPDGPGPGSTTSRARSTTASKTSRSSTRSKA